jgi:hypothetical protein
MKVTMQRIRLNSGGYDATGTYWGRTHEGLYRVEFPERVLGSEVHFIRAWDRADAKRIVATKFPETKFYR